MLFMRAGESSNTKNQTSGGLRAQRRDAATVAAVVLALLLPCVAQGQNQAPIPSTAQPSTAPSTPITMQQAVDIAKMKNPTLLSSRANLQSVKAQEIQAGVRTNPYLNISAGNVTLGPNDANPYYYVFGVGRLFERGQKRRWRLDIAQSTTAQTDAQYHLQEEQTVLAVRQAFTNFVLAKTAKKLADDNLGDFRHEVQIGGERLKAGDIAKLDFERLDLQLAQFESDESNAVTNAQQASIQLQTLMGYDRPNSAFDVIGDIVPPGVTDTVTDLEQKAIQARPDFHAAQAAVAVADANVKMAYANGTADPTAEVDYNLSGGESSVGFSLNIPLRLFDRNQGNKETSKYLATASRFTETAARNQVYSDVDQAWAGYVNAKVLSDRYNGHYLEEAKDILDISKFSYEHGGLALIDYLDALRQSRSTQSDALNAYAQTWMAIHQLSFTTATDVVP